MKNYPILLFVALCVVGLAIQGCNSTQQGQALNTIASTEIATKAAYDAYATAVIEGAAPTNNVPAVSKAFNDFQSGVILATVTVQGNTNALAPSNLVTLSSAVLNLISQLSTNK